MIKEGLRHHDFNILKGVARNARVLKCRLFGHRINSNKDHAWCERCGLAYEEIYYKLK